MPVRGTKDYVWFTEQRLGSGSTGKVYCGRHKRRGDVCAVKVFEEQVRPAIVQAKERELKLIGKLNHENIVKLLDIQRETHTKENVLIMELCSEGSVYDMINKPEYYFGFPESEFLVFLQDFASGLEYLRTNDIIHRDIKPGNILCSVGEDGRSVYKLTDFGSAHEQNNEEDTFMSLHGTEEYLHPDLYGSALMGAKPDKVGFGAATDLWSIGATLYHVATGQLPFQSFGGRNNREAMFRIISEKKHGEISGIQKQQDQNITWSKELPKTCRLSQSLKAVIISIIAGTMEKDPRHQWKFHLFFETCRKFVSLNRIHFYSCLALQACPLYLPKSSSLLEVKKELVILTGIAADNQLWLHDRADLLEIMSGSSDINQLPMTSENNPIVLWSKPSGITGNKPEPVISLESPAFSADSSNVAGDVIWSRDVSAMIIHNMRSLDNLLQAQSCLYLIWDVLCELNITCFKKHQQLFEESRRIFASVTQSCEFLHGTTSSEATSTATSAVATSIDTSAVATSSSSVSASHDKTMIGKLVRLEKHIQFQIHGYLQDNPSIVGQQISDCEIKKCKSKLETYINQAKSTHEQFKKDKQRTLTYNEEQIHKYDKIKLNDVLKKSTKLLMDHCLFHTRDHYRKLVDWYSNELKGYSDQLLHIEKDLKKFRAVCMDVLTSMEKNFDKSKQLQRDASPLSSGMPGTFRRSCSTGTQSGELCSTATALPTEIFIANLDLLRISQADNMSIQQAIENQLKENDEILNRVYEMFYAGSSGP